MADCRHDTSSREVLRHEVTIVTDRDYKHVELMMCLGLKGLCEVGEES